MKLRKVLIGLAVLFLVAFLPSVKANAESFDFTVGSWTYYYSDGTVSIKSYNGSSATVSVPGSVTYSGTTYKIRTIEAGAFANKTSLKNVTIPSSVTRLGNGVFRNCTSLSSVTINGDLQDCSGNSVNSSGYNPDTNYSVFYNAGTNASSLL